MFDFSLELSAEPVKRERDRSRWRGAHQSGGNSRDCLPQGGKMIISHGGA